MSYSTRFVLRRVAAAAVVVVLVAVGTHASAFSGVVVEAPPALKGTPEFDPRTGLRVEIDARWFDAGGYRPVRVRVESEKPVTRETKVEVRLAFSDSGRPNDEDLVVSTWLTLKVKESFVEGVVRCPALSDWSSLAWRAYVDGEFAAGVSSADGNPIPLAAGGQDAFMRLLRPDRGRALAGGLRDQRSRSTLTVGRNGRMMVDRVRSEPLAEWLDYTSVEAVTFTLAGLRSFAEEQPEAHAALRRWLLAGGVLWIEQAGDRPESFQAIDELLALDRWRMTSTDEEIDELTYATPPPVAAAPDGAPAVAEPPSGTPGETDSEAGERKGSVTPVEGAPDWGYLNVAVEEAFQEGLRQEAPQVPGQKGWQGETLRLAERILQLREPGFAEPVLPRDTRGWFAQRDAGFGRVVAFRQLTFDVPLGLVRGPARQVLTDWNNDRWAMRHGVQPAGASPEFGNLLVPGVGMAPVMEFQVLITLFVLAIGPLNYWLLWRRQQLQLLVVTTPLAALAATLALAAYASVADGFGVKARAQSVTMIDQVTEEAASWSRVSHYVATTPEELPTIPGDAAIYPVAPGWESALAVDVPQRIVRWEASEKGGGASQTLPAGWFPARTTVQHVIVRSRTTPAKLEFTGERVAEGLQVANRLGAPIDLVVVRDAEGAWSQADAIEEGAAAALKGVERLDAMKAFRTLAIANVPTFPAGAGKAIEDTLERLGGSGDLRRLQRSMATVRLSENLGARALDALTGLDGGRSLDVPPRSYIAVTSGAVETPLGWDGVEELGSFHVVLGRW